VVRTFERECVCACLGKRGRSNFRSLFYLFFVHILIYIDIWMEEV